MRFFKSYKNDMIDLHCHSVPFVDDGAEDFEDAKEIIRTEYNQGVRTMVMTVHLREGMFDTPISSVQSQFQRIQEWLKSSNMKDMSVFLSREYYCDKRLEVLLDGYINNLEEIVYEGKKYIPQNEIRPFGKKNCILLEFSSNKIQDIEFEIFVKKASLAGLTPIIAHIERYPAVQKRPAIVYNLKDIGAYIQVNGEALLTKTSKKEFELVKWLLESQLVDFISSDTHDLLKRPPNLKRCYAYISKKYGKCTADNLLRNKAFYLIHDMQ